MTPEIVRLLCLENNGYETPRLNEKLYLHFKGFSRIGGLDEYVGAKCLWLESNGIRKIENIEKLVHLSALYLQNNLISVIENVDTLKNLVTLNLSGNNIRTIGNLSALKKLRTLDVSKNKLQTSKDVDHLRACKSLVTIDLSLNNIGEIPVEDIFGPDHLPLLSSLKLEGNPIVNKMKSYRKTLILALPRLSSLDSRPIFSADRGAAESWKEGGHKAELASRKSSHAKEKALRKEQMKQFREWKIRRTRELRAERTAKRSLLEQEAKTPVTENCSNVPRPVVTEFDDSLIGRLLNNVHCPGGGLRGRVSSYDRSKNLYRVDYEDTSWDFLTTTFLRPLLLPAGGDVEVKRPFEVSCTSPPSLPRPDDISTGVSGGVATKIFEPGLAVSATTPAPTPPTNLDTLD